MIQGISNERCYAKISIEDTFGQGGVQTLDGAAHHHRKNIFMDLMTPERMERSSSS